MIADVLRQLANVEAWVAFWWGSVNNLPAGWWL